MTRIALILLMLSLASCTGRRNGDDGMDGLGVALGVREVMLQHDR